MSAVIALCIALFGAATVPSHKGNAQIMTMQQQQEQWRQQQQREQQQQATQQQQDNAIRQFHRDYNCATSSLTKPC